MSVCRGGGCTIQVGFVQSDMCSIECLVFLCLSVYSNSKSAFFLFPYPIPAISFCWQPNEIILHHNKASEKRNAPSLLYRFIYFFSVIK